MTKIRSNEPRRTVISSIAQLCVATIVFVSQQTPLAAQAKRIEISVYESSEALKESLQAKPSLRFQAAKQTGAAIHIDEQKTFQQIDGFGASLTDASAWLFEQKLTPAQRKDLLVQLFDAKKGIGLNILRQPMGSSDFAREDYSYDDLPSGQTDSELKSFSIARDRECIIPMLREILAVNPAIKIIGSPWSPPGWMKTSGSMIGGTLLPSSYAPLAKYFVEFVKQYEAAGVPIFGITPENEPRNIPSDYPGMGMTAEEQATFVRDHVGPAFRAAHLKTKILIFDHNWDLMDFPTKILGDSHAAEFVAGTATHCYGGNPAAQTELHDRFPAKDIWLTECSGGNWQKGNLLVSQVSLIVQTTRNWGKSVALWNLALDQNHAPHLGGCTDCRGVVTIDHSTSPTTVIPTVDFNALAHASKFVRAGAFRVASGADEQPGLEQVAFRNSDGSIVLLAVNSGEAPVAFNIEWRGEFASYTLDAGAAATFTWASAGKKAR